MKHTRVLFGVPFRQLLPLIVVAVVGAQRVHAGTVLGSIRTHPLLRAPTNGPGSGAGHSNVDARVTAIAARLAERLTAVRAQSRSTARAARTTPHAPPGAFIDAPLDLRLRPGVGTPMQLYSSAYQSRALTVPFGADRTAYAARAYLRDHRRVLQLDDPDTELAEWRRETDALGWQHVRYAQRYRGLPVWPAQLTVHLDPDGRAVLLNGAFIATPRTVNDQPGLNADAAIEQARAAVPRGSSGAASAAPDLIVYAPGDALPRLAWKLELHVSSTARWLVVIDANSGDTLMAFNQVMEAGVSTNGRDIFGTERPLNVWQDSSTFYLLDASKPMFDPASPVPTLDTRGAIIILDGQNTEQGGQVTSTQRNRWLPADAVSAAFGLSETYDYYLSHHGRNSIDGQGGTLLGFVRYKQGFQNAFWDGTFMVFGDGEPYAGALDVVGHELTHGVTQHTANLVYQDQSGALNESLSDIFGQAVEARTYGRIDWLHGDVLTGQRNMADPSAIAICSGCRAYPSRMSEFIRPDDPFLDRFLNRDSGGVHLNSSIINHAFYLLAEGLPAAIGLDRAERIFYRALTVHLVTNSKFIDARLACVTSAEEIFGRGSTEARMTAAAFDTVEIFDGRGTPVPPRFPPVNGQDALLFLFFDPDAEAYFLARKENGIGDPPGGVLLAESRLADARPSVAGDGSFAAFVDDDHDICLIKTDGTQFDPETETLERCLGFPGFISSLAVAPGGNRFGFVLLDEAGNPDNRIRVIDTPVGIHTFNLRAPTIDAETTDTILFADAMDFTADGRFVIYDALNELRIRGGPPVHAWSIFALDVETGITQALAPPTRGFDIRNPALSQTSDSFITFDVYDADSNSSTVVAMNLTTGDAAEVATVNGGLGVPGFTGDDSAIVYSQLDAGTPTEFSLTRQPLATDHISPQGAPSLLLRNSDFGVIYRRGTFVGPVGCVGDCDADAAVTIDEILIMVNIAQGATGPSACPAGDGNRDGEVTVDEILAAVTAALNGC